jgi:8-oxo-dGTP pyrophosphatase MutT (NUDIX family)
MQLPYVYCLGNFQANQISIFPETISSRKIKPELEQKLVSAWEQLQKQANDDGKQVWDSELYRLEAVKKRKDNLDITLSTILFSTRKMITQYLPEVLSLGEDYFSKGMFSSIFIRTSDNLYAFLKKSNLFVARNNYSFVGGAYSKAEQKISNGQDLFEIARKEIFEELNITDNDVRNISMISIFITSQTHTCFLFDCQLNLTSQELIEKYNLSHDPESSELILLHLEQIEEFLTKNLPGDVNKMELFMQAQHLPTLSL